METIFSPDTLLDLFASSLVSEFLNKWVLVEGVYFETAKYEYHGYYYDELRTNSGDAKITIKIRKEDRMQFTDGRFYQISGHLCFSKAQLFDSSKIGLIFFVDRLKKGENEIQKISLGDYELLKSRFVNGFVNIEVEILRLLRDNKKPKILILTGKESIIDQDIISQLSDIDRYEITFERVNLSSKKELSVFLQRSLVLENSFFAIARGGGASISLFDDPDICRILIEKRQPFITAIGHEMDKPLLQKLADLSFQTPIAFGEFLDKMIRVDEAYKSELRRKSLIMQKSLDQSKEKLEFERNNYLSIIKELKVKQQEQISRILVIAGLCIIFVSSLIFIYLSVKT
ncbi:MAG TPA: exodeoxyribonuclease VII large subunit [Paludibacter sp.]|nr:exodeoxyribonuclease VII large subunit [Paludibacter sp.]